MNNEPVAWMLKTGHGTKILEKKPYCEVDYWIPLYTHQYERPHNTVLVPCDKLAEMQAEIKRLTQENHDLWEQLATADKVYDFDNPLLDKAQEK